MKILQLNMHRSKVADALLPQIMIEERAVIAIISEQYGRKGGLWIDDESATAAVWIPDTSKLALNKKGKGNCFAWLQIEDLTLVSCYLTPSDSIEDFEGKLNGIEDFIRTIRGHIIVAGDLNAKAVEWGMQITDARGRRIVNMMARAGLIVANTGNTPTFRRPGCEATIPDVTLVTERTLCRIAEWKVLESYTGSDHQYISYNIGTGAVRGSEEEQRYTAMTRKWNSAKLNVGILLMEIEQRMSAVPETQDASKAAEVLISDIQRSCDKAMPRIGVSRRRRKSVYWWNDDIARARRECCKCRRRLTRARRQGDAENERKMYREAKRQLHRQIFNSKNRLWESLREDVNSDPWGMGYKIVMGKFCSKNATPVMNGDKMTRIVRSLFPEHDDLMEELTLVEDIDIPLFTKEELITAVSKLKPGKAPGPDGIPSEVIKEIAYKCPELLLKTFNKCLVEGTFPRIWKVQRLVLINKGKGDPDSPSAYRPLCMLDTTGKLLERLIKPRLMGAIDTRGGLSERQHGFRPGRSTLGALRDVVHAFEAAQRINHFSRPLILLATLDVKNAFNSLRWKNVFHALENRFQVPLYLRRLIRSYLSNRELIYKTTDGQRSIKVTSGAAQGSILGPDLWNISYDSILRMEMPQDTFLVGYADDIAAVISARDTEEAERKLKQVMIRVKTWMDSHGLSLATQKTELLLLTRRHIATEIALNVDGITLHTKRCLNYLGIRLDPKMTYSNQIHHAAAKAARITAQLSRLMANIGGPTQIKRRLLMEASSSILLYGCEIWGEAIRWKKRANALLAVQRISALRITSAYRTVSGAAVLVIAGAVPIDLKIRERRQLWMRNQNNRLEQQQEDQIRRGTLQAWQARWTVETKGRWTARLIPHLESWLRRRTGEVNYYLTQLLSGHGYFREYLHKMGKCETPYCLYEEEDHIDDAEHTFFTCARWAQQRRELEDRIGHLTVANLIPSMLSDETRWNAVRIYCEEILRLKKKDLDTAN